MYPYDSVRSRLNYIGFEVSNKCLFIFQYILLASSSFSEPVIVLGSIPIGVADSHALIHDAGVF